MTEPTRPDLTNEATYQKWHAGHLPTWTLKCECGCRIEHYRGEGDTACRRCGTCYNAFGQRLRDDWATNPAWDES